MASNLNFLESNNFISYNRALYPIVRVVYILQNTVKNKLSILEHKR